MLTVGQGRSRSSASRLAEVAKTSDRVAIIEEVGPAISTFKKGDHVLISCISSCGRCENTERGIAAIVALAFFFILINCVHTA
ncbi:alcohol dehydrogenase catalytic domain-containing protein [Xanthobacter sp. V4C-4]|uniref:alcohol dehydrogenase catalytic domain-containing protein n=1 Tax=Xanthobacter cornucopiae TaxID=3119924 RepID=UPI0037281053